MRCPTARRGLTLVELLVTIALMLLIMSVIVALFDAATDGIMIARTDQELASVTRRLDTLIRQDLSGATARFTPPLDPNDGLGYFEYGENMFADDQGEDSDDYIALTAKAPPGQPFTGRIMLPRGFWDPPANTRPRFVPTTITSEYAEIIYFLRNNNLYRRVFLIAPDRAGSIANSVDLLPSGVYRYSAAPYFSDGFDLDGPADPRGDNTPDVSWQGANDISVRPADASSGQAAPIPNTLGDLTDRHNRAFRPRFRNDFVNAALDPIPDGIFDDTNRLPDGTPAPDGVPDLYPTLYPGVFAAGWVNEANARIPGLNTYDLLPFPFLFPGAYSKPNVYSIPVGGLIHTGPVMTDATGALVINHSPLDLGDNLPVPDVPAEQYTWWGFPTAAETRGLAWTAANRRTNVADEFGRPFGIQAFGLSWQYGLVNDSPEWLPRQSHWYTDNFPTPNSPLAHIPLAVQDDLVATNVRSFDVKALEPNGAANGVGFSKTVYRDLGYAQLDSVGSPLTPNQILSFGHEGRMPPLPRDNRFDHQGLVVYGQEWSIGDLGTTMPVVRMRRVWDSWSTTYAFAPRRGIDVANHPGPPFERPVYPSYPPPYPSPLYGIQIQIRLAAPDGTRPKVLTIRQDFTDKL